MNTSTYPKKMHLFSPRNQLTHRLPPPCARQCRCSSWSSPSPLLQLLLRSRLLPPAAASRPPRRPRPPPPPAPAMPWEAPDPDQRRIRRPDRRWDAREEARSLGGGTGKPVEGNSSWSSLPYSCGWKNGGGGGRSRGERAVGIFEVGVGKGVEIGGV